MYGKYRIHHHREFDSMKIKLFIPEIRFEFHKNSFASCIDRWFHGQSGKSKSEKRLPHDRAYFFIRVQSSSALFPRDNENGGALHILYTDGEGGKRVREVFAFNQPLLILKSL